MCECGHSINKHGDSNEWNEERGRFEQVALEHICIPGCGCKGFKAAEKPITHCSACNQTKWLITKTEQVKCANCGLMRELTETDMEELDVALNNAYIAHMAKLN